MDDLERYEDCIIDNKGSIVIDLTKNIIYHFDFDDMTVKSNNTSSIKPIRFMEKEDKIRIWGSRSWLRLGNPSAAKAVTKLFNNYNERILLGLNKIETEEICLF